MDTIRINAPAKINLGLDVVRKREDGYHEVKMIMQSIFLHDKVILRKSRTPGIFLKTNLGFLPVNENNLVYKAAKLLLDEFNIDTGLKIKLEKHIPVAAGMAGGSSDAAATLIGLNKLLDLSLSQEDLMKRGVTLGADIPYCVMKGTALSEGIGEILTPLKPAPACHVLIAKPNIHVSTKFVYENLKLDENLVHPDIDGIVQDIENEDLHGMCQKLGNVLESVTISEYPQIQRLKDIMINSGATGALMSGSGPTVFGLFEHEKSAKLAYNKCINDAKQNFVFLTKFYQN